MLPATTPDEDAPIPVDIPSAVATAASAIYGRYSDWVPREDIHQEILLYTLGAGKKIIGKWAAEGDHLRVQLALRGAGKQYCENEKAVVSGYSFDDLAWYSPEKIADLIPLALNPNFDGMSGDDGDVNGGRGQTAGREGGGLLAMVLDVRRALDKVGLEGVVNIDTDTLTTDPACLHALSEFLGGDYPNAPGYQRDKRKAISNSRAIAITTNQDEGGDRGSDN